MSRLWFVATAIACGAAFGGELSSLENFYGTSALSTVTGNGALTAGLDRTGQVVVCRWPSPVLQDQLGSARAEGGAAVAVSGLSWGIEVKGAVVWPGDPRWEHRHGYAGAAAVSVTTSRLADSAISVMQTTFVHPTADVLVSRVEVHGAEAAPALYWRADFTPTTRVLPELPIADWALDAANDFAAVAFESRKAVFHFRPRAPDARAWRVAEQLAGRGAPLPEWASFGQGVWIAYASPHNISGYFCGTIDVPLDDAIDQLRSAPTASVGASYSLIEIAPRKIGDTYEAVVMAAFGENAKRASDVLDAFRDRDSKALEQATSEHWDLRVAGTAVDWAPDDGLRDDLRRCLSIIAASTDRHTGAVARSVSVRPPLARDWPRHGAWINYCLDLAGYRELSETRARFYAAVVRSERRKGRPYGSLPSAVYADGGDAAPHLIVDVDAVSLTLWSYHQHALRLDLVGREAFVASVWDSAVRMTDFLAAWRGVHGTVSMPTFDPEAWEERGSRAAMIHARMGLAAALEMAKIAGAQPPPAWTRRHQELEVFVRNLCLDASLEWTLAEALPFSLTDILPVNDPRFVRAAEARVRALDHLDRADAARALLELAMLWRDSPERLAELRGIVGPTVHRLLYESGSGVGETPAFPDTAAAAMGYIAAWIAFNSENG